MTLNNTKKNYILKVILIFIITMFLVNTFYKTSYAVGMFDSAKASSKALHSRYDISNYQLDFYYDTSGDWLPWNWAEGIGKVASYGMYSITNGYFMVSAYISKGLASIIGYVYSFDFVDRACDYVGNGIRRYAGFSSSGGFLSKGLYPSLLIIAIVSLGAYIAYVGLLKREVSKALSSTVSFLLVLFLSVNFFMYSPDYLKKANEFSNGIASLSLDVGSSLTFQGSGNGDNVSKLKDTLFSIQVYQPWYLMQYGDTNPDIKSKSEILKLDFSSKEREEKVEEAVKAGNDMMSLKNVFYRFAIGQCLFIFNLIISFFVLLLCGYAFFTQIMFLIVSLFLPIGLFISLFPNMGYIGKRSISKMFNAIMARGIVIFVISVTFSLASLGYTLAKDFNFFFVMFLEIVIFVGVFLKLPQIMSILEVDGRGQGANKMVHGTQRLTRQIVSGAIGSYIGNKTGNRSVYSSSSNKSTGENQRKETQSKSSDEMRKNSDFSDKKTGNSKGNNRKDDKNFRDKEFSRDFKKTSDDINSSRRNKVNNRQSKLRDNNLNNTYRNSSDYQNIKNNGYDINSRKTSRVNEDKHTSLRQNSRLSTFKRAEGTSRKSNVRQENLRSRSR